MKDFGIYRKTVALSAGIEKILSDNKKGKGMGGGKITEGSGGPIGPPNVPSKQQQQHTPVGQKDGVTYKHIKSLEAVGGGDAHRKISNQALKHLNEKVVTLGFSEGTADLSQISKLFGKDFENKFKIAEGSVKDGNGNVLEDLSSAARKELEVFVRQVFKVSKGVGEGGFDRFREGHASSGDGEWKGVTADGSAKVGKKNSMTAKQKYDASWDKINKFKDRLHVVEKDGNGEVWFTATDNTEVLVGHLLEIITPEGGNGLFKAKTSDDRLDDIKKQIDKLVEDLGEEALDPLRMSLDAFRKEENPEDIFKGVEEAYNDYIAAYNECIGKGSGDLFSSHKAALDAQKKFYQKLREKAQSEQKLLAETDHGYTDREHKYRGKMLREQIEGYDTQIKEIDKKLKTCEGQKSAEAIRSTLAKEREEIDKQFGSVKATFSNVKIQRDALITSTEEFLTRMQDKVNKEKEAERPINEKEKSFVNFREEVTGFSGGFESKRKEYSKSLGGFKSDAGVARQTFVSKTKRLKGDSTANLSAEVQAQDKELKKFTDDVDKGIQQHLIDSWLSRETILLSGIGKKKPPVENLTWKTDLRELVGPGFGVDEGDTLESRFEAFVGEFVAEKKGGHGDEVEVFDDDVKAFIITQRGQAVGGERFSPQNEVEARIKKLKGAAGDIFQKLEAKGETNKKRGEYTTLYSLTKKYSAPAELAKMLKLSTEEPSKRSYLNECVEKFNDITEPKDGTKIPYEDISLLSKKMLEVAKFSKSFSLEDKAKLRALSKHFKRYADVAQMQPSGRSRQDAARRAIIAKDAVGGGDKLRMDAFPFVADEDLMNELKGYVAILSGSEEGDRPNKEKVGTALAKLKKAIKDGPNDTTDPGGKLQKFEEAKYIQLAKYFEDALGEAKPEKRAELGTVKAVTVKPYDAEKVQCPKLKAQLLEPRDVLKLGLPTLKKLGEKTVDDVIETFNIALKGKAKDLTVEQRHTLLAYLNKALRMSLLTLKNESANVEGFLSLYQKIQGSADGNVLSLSAAEVEDRKLTMFTAAYALNTESAFKEDGIKPKGEAYAVIARQLEMMDSPEARKLLDKMNVKYDGLGGKDKDFRGWLPHGGVKTTSGEEIGGGAATARNFLMQGLLEGVHGFNVGKYTVTVEDAGKGEHSHYSHKIMVKSGETEIPLHYSPNGNVWVDAFPSGVPSGDEEFSLQHFMAVARGVEDAGKCTQSMAKAGFTGEAIALVQAFETREFQLKGVLDAIQSLEERGDLFDFDSMRDFFEKAMTQDRVIENADAGDVNALIEYLAGKATEARGKRDEKTGAFKTDNDMRQYCFFARTLDSLVTRVLVKGREGVDASAAESVGKAWEEFLVTSEDKENYELNAHHLWHLTHKETLEDADIAVCYRLMASLEAAEMKIPDADLKKDYGHAQRIYGEAKLHMQHHIEAVSTKMKEVLAQDPGAGAADPHKACKEWLKGKDLLRDSRYLALKPLLEHFSTGKPGFITTGAVEKLLGKTWTDMGAGILQLEGVETKDEKGNMKSVKVQVDVMTGKCMIEGQELVSAYDTILAGDNRTLYEEVFGDKKLALTPAKPTDGSGGTYYQAFGGKYTLHVNDQNKLIIYRRESGGKQVRYLPRADFLRKVSGDSGVTKKFLVHEDLKPWVDDAGSITLTDGDGQHLYKCDTNGRIVSDTSGHHLATLGGEKLKKNITSFMGTEHGAHAYVMEKGEERRIVMKWEGEEVVLEKRGENSPLQYDKEYNLLDSGGELAEAFRAQYPILDGSEMLFFQHYEAPEKNLVMIQEEGRVFIYDVDEGGIKPRSREAGLVMAKHLYDKGSPEDAMHVVRASWSHDKLTEKEKALIKEMITVSTESTDKKGEDPFMLQCKMLVAGMYFHHMQLNEKKNPQEIDEDGSIEILVNTFNAALGEKGPLFDVDSSFRGDFQRYVGGMVRDIPGLDSKVKNALSFEPKAVAAKRADRSTLKQIRKYDAFKRALNVKRSISAMMGFKEKTTFKEKKSEGKLTEEEQIEELVDKDRQGEPGIEEDVGKLRAALRSMPKEHELEGDKKGQCVEIKKHLTAELEKWQREETEVRSRLETVATRLMGSYKKGLTAEGVVVMLMRNRAGAMLTPEEKHLVENLALRHLYAQTELRQLAHTQKMLSKFESTEYKNPDAERDLVEALRSSRQYDMKDILESEDNGKRLDALSMMFCEYNQGFRLRENQATLLKKLLGTGECDPRIVQMGTGEGKTSVFFFTLALRFADGEHLVKLTSPDALKTMNMNDLNDSYREAFNATVHEFTFDPSHKKDVAYLEHMYEELEGIRKRGDMIITSPHTMDDPFKASLDMLRREGGSAEALKWMKKIQKLFIDHGFEVVDEADKINDPLKDYHIVGSVQIDSSPEKNEIAFAILEAARGVEGFTFKCNRAEYDAKWKPKIVDKLMLILSELVERKLGESGVGLPAELYKYFKLAEGENPERNLEEIVAEFVGGDADRTPSEEEDKEKKIEEITELLGAYHEALHYGFFDAVSDAKDVDVTFCINNERNLLAVPCVGGRPTPGSEFEQTDMTRFASFVALEHNGLQRLETAEQGKPVDFRFLERILEYIVDHPEFKEEQEKELFELEMEALPESLQALRKIAEFVESKRGEASSDEDLKRMVLSIARNDEQRYEETDEKEGGIYSSFVEIQTCHEKGDSDAVHYVGLYMIIGEQLTIAETMYSGDRDDRLVPDNNRRSFSGTFNGKTLSGQQRKHKEDLKKDGTHDLAFSPQVELAFRKRVHKSKGKCISLDASKEKTDVEKAKKNLKTILTGLGTCEQAKKMKSQMIVDAGARMKGLSNFGAAKQIQEHFQGGDKGQFKKLVVYCDETTGKLRYLDMNGTSKPYSPKVAAELLKKVPKEDFFIYLDQGRSTGTDTKAIQHDDCHAVVTVGTLTDTSDIKQAIGRLRMPLTQKFTLAGEDGFLKQVAAKWGKDASDVTTKDIIDYIRVATAEKDDGLAFYVFQGELKSIKARAIKARCKELENDDGTIKEGSEVEYKKLTAMIGDTKKGEELWTRRFEKAKKLEGKAKEEYLKKLADACKKEIGAVFKNNKESEAFEALEASIDTLLEIKQKDISTVSGGVEATNSDSTTQVEAATETEAATESQATTEAQVEAQATTTAEMILGRNKSGTVTIPNGHKRDIHSNTPDVSKYAALTSAEQLKKVTASLVDISGDEAQASGEKRKYPDRYLHWMKGDVQNKEGDDSSVESEMSHVWNMPNVRFSHNWLSTADSALKDKKTPEGGEWCRDGDFFRPAMEHIAIHNGTLHVLTQAEAATIKQHESGFKGVTMVSLKTALSDLNDAGVPEGCRTDFLKLKLFAGMATDEDMKRSEAGTLVKAVVDESVMASKADGADSGYCTTEKKKMELATKVVPEEKGDDLSCTVTVSGDFKLGKNGTSSTTISTGEVPEDHKGDNIAGEFSAELKAQAGKKREALEKEAAAQKAKLDKAMEEAAESSSGEVKPGGEGVFLSRLNSKLRPQENIEQRWEKHLKKKFPQGVPLELRKALAFDSSVSVEVWQGKVKKALDIILNKMNFELKQKFDTLTLKGIMLDDPNKMGERGQQVKEFRENVKNVERGIKRLNNCLAENAKLEKENESLTGEMSKLEQRVKKGKGNRNLTEIRKELTEKKEKMESNRKKIAENNGQKEGREKSLREKKEELSKIEAEYYLLMKDVKRSSKVDLNGIGGFLHLGRNAAGSASNMQKYIKELAGDASQAYVFTVDQLQSLCDIYRYYSDPKLSTEIRGKIETAFPTFIRIKSAGKGSESVITGCFQAGGQGVAADLIALLKHFGDVGTGEGFIDGFWDSIEMGKEEKNSIVEGLIGDGILQKPDDINPGEYHKIYDRMKEDDFERLVTDAYSKGNSTLTFKANGNDVTINLKGEMTEEQKQKKIKDLIEGDPTKYGLLDPATGKPSETKITSLVEEEQNRLKEGLGEVCGDSTLSWQMSGRYEAVASQMAALKFRCEGVSTSKMFEKKAEEVSGAIPDEDSLIASRKSIMDSLVTGKDSSAAREVFAGQRGNALAAVTNVMAGASEQSFSRTTMVETKQAVEVMKKDRRVTDKDAFSGELASRIKKQREEYSQGFV
jgi:hypothetical protein